MLCTQLPKANTLHSHDTIQKLEKNSPSYVWLDFIFWNPFSNFFKSLSSLVYSFHEFCFVWDRGSHYIAQADLEFTL